MTTPDHENRPTIDVYPVGLFSDWRSRRMQQGWRYLRRQTRHGNWRAVRNYFNGYLAEVNYPGGLRHTRCGHGWTRRRATRRLGVYLARDNERVTS